MGLGAEAGAVLEKVGESGVGNLSSLMVPNGGVRR